MRVATSLNLPAGSEQPPWSETVDFAREAERAGVDSLWAGEAWIYDAVTPLAYLAAVTERIKLGAGILQITARAPALTAMTALSLQQISQGRFLLGLGASGPKVVQALHGVPFRGSLSRLRETLDVVRMGLAGERIVYDGEHLKLPLPGHERDAMRLGLPPAPELPIYLGSLSPASLELTGECADGWLAQVFVPEGSAAAFASLETGAARSGRRIADLDIVAGAPLAFGDDVDALIESGRHALAFTLGAMGSSEKNFYVDAYARAGFDAAARRVQALWLDRKREEAVRAVPDEMVLQTRLIGTDDMIRQRIAAYRAAGVTTLRVVPEAPSLEARIEALGRVVALVEESNAEAPGRSTRR